MNTGTISVAGSHARLRHKIVLIIWTLRALGSAYALWVLLHILRPLRDTDAFLQLLGSHWQRDLAGGQTWQVWSAVGLNLAIWLTLLVAVVCLWQGTRHLLRDMGLSPASITSLQRGAWAGLICAVLGIVTRPFVSYLHTLHLPVESQLWLWSLYPNDLLNLLTGVVLLMLAYLMAWMAEIAEENKAFV